MILLRGYTDFKVRICFLFLTISLSVKCAMEGPHQTFYSGFQSTGTLYFGEMVLCVGLPILQSILPMSLKPHLPYS